MGEEEMNDEEGDVSLKREKGYMSEDIPRNA